MKISSRLWWKVYFCLMALAATAGVWTVATQDQPLRIIDFADVASWTFSLAGVFGLAFSKPIGGARIWQVWLPIVVLWDVWFFVRDHVYESEEFDPWLTMFVACLVGVLVIPQYVALYLYGYRSEALWTNRDLTMR